MPAANPVVAIDDHGPVRVEFPQAGREFRERDMHGTGKVRNVVLPRFAHVEKLSTTVRELFADSVRRQLADVIHAAVQKLKRFGFHALTSAGIAVSNRLSTDQSSAETRT